MINSEERMNPRWLIKVLGGLLLWKDLSRLRHPLLDAFCQDLKEPVTIEVMDTPSSTLTLI
jgi:hypothetical protein